MHILWYMFHPNAPTPVTGECHTPAHFEDYVTDFQDTISKRQITDSFLPEQFLQNPSWTKSRTISFESLIHIHLSFF